MAMNFKENQEKLRQANEIAHQLEQLLNQEDLLTNSAKAAASTAKESQVLLELAKLPLEKLRDASDEPVRLETLRKYGFTNVGSVYNSTSIALEKIPGISLEAAQSLKSVADQMYLAVAQSIAYGIDLDDLSTADNKLIEKNHLQY